MTELAERQHSRSRLGGVRALSRIFDDLVPVPGTRIRFGLDSIIGLLPGGGDLVGGVVSAYALMVATQLGAPASVIARMVMNIAADTIVGAVPLLGDIFDVAFKSNRRNLALLEEFENNPQKVRRSSVAVLIVALIVLLLLITAAALIGIWIIRAAFHLLSN